VRIWVVEETRSPPCPAQSGPVIQRDERERVGRLYTRGRLGPLSSSDYIIAQASAAAIIIGSQVNIQIREFLGFRTNEGYQNPVRKFSEERRRRPNQGIL